MDESLCPCGTGTSYDACCGPIHDRGAGLGRTAEQLMRARFSAYVRCDQAFLLRSWHVDTRPAEVSFDENVEWVGLEVISTSDGSGFDSTGVVEFKARYLRNEQPLELHEISSFERVDGAWVYIDGR